MTALLRYSSHTIKFSHLQCTAQWPAGYSQRCASITTIYFQNIFIIPKRNPMPTTVRPSSPPSPSSAQPPPASKDLPYLDISPKWHPTSCGPSWLMSFTQHCVFKAHPGCCVCQDFILLVAGKGPASRAYHTLLTHPGGQCWQAAAARAESLLPHRRGQLSSPPGCLPSLTLRGGIYYRPCTPVSF